MVSTQSRRSQAGGRRWRYGFPKPRGAAHRWYGDSVEHSISQAPFSEAQAVWNTARTTAPRAALLHGHVEAEEAVPEIDTVAAGEDGEGRAEAVETGVAEFDDAGVE